MLASSSLAGHPGAGTLPNHAHRQTEGWVTPHWGSQKPRDTRPGVRVVTSKACHTLLGNPAKPQGWPSAGARLALTSTSPGHAPSPCFHWPCPSSLHPPHTQGGGLSPSRLDRAGLATTGPSWDDQSPAPASSHWLERNFCKMSPHGPRNPACPPPHMGPESWNPRVSPLPVSLYKKVPEDFQPPTRRWTGTWRRSPVAQCGLTSWAQPTPHLQRGPRPWQSAVGARRACRGPSLCQTRPPQCRA
jgi:hypothetical protein